MQDRIFLSFTRFFAVLLTIAIFAFGQSALIAEEQPGFFRYPHTNGEWVVFTSEGDLWRAPISGGTAIRLTTHEGEERYPFISPDGAAIAFSGQDDGQDDIYVMPLMGGEPKRLTFHPGGDQVVGWLDDDQILFRSRREIPFRGYRIYTVSKEGGFPDVIPLTKAALISFEPGGSRIAFNRYSREFRNWKRYKGGWAQDVWVGDLEKDEFLNIVDNAPTNDWDGTDAFPMWHTDGRIYFISDRDGRLNVHSMRPDGSDLKQHTFHDKFDVRWPSMGGGYITYQNGMDVWALNLETFQTDMIDIRLPTDRVQARTKYADPKKYISYFDLNHDGSRLLLCSRGELYTAPTKGEGLIRQLTFDSGVRQKFPHWTNDGEKVFFWSDDTGEEQLYSIPAKGGEKKLIGYDKRGWHYPALPSPDGKWAAFTNEELELIVMEIESGDKKFVDIGSWEIRDYKWSPDSRYIVYSRPEENGANIIRVWDSKREKVHSITDDYFNSFSPAFDPEGKYLYFLSDRISNPYLDWREMTYILNKRTLPFVVMLDKETLSPFAPEATPKDGDEDEWWKDGKGDKDKKKDRKKVDEKPVEVEIDFDRIEERIAAFPVDPGNYGELDAVKNKIFYVEWENKGMLGRRLFEDDEGGMKLHKYNLKKKKHKLVESGVDGYDISADGEKLLIWKNRRFTVQGIDDGGFGDWGGKDKDDENDKHVDLSQWDLRVNVKDEWRQMFRESWRLQRDFFWTPDLHKVDWQAVYDKYAPLAQRISTRDELSDLIGEMFAELNCSHTYVWGGDQRSAKRHSTGLLGADLSRHESGYYRIDRIIDPRPWDEDLSSPLAEPGMKVKEGDYIVAVNGRSVLETENIFRLFLNKADKIISLTVSGEPSGKETREVIVKPIDHDYYLRYWNWIENRKAYVAEKSDRKIGYIHLANMGGLGLSQFTEAYQPQHRKQGLILDVRYNGGGFVAPMILAHLGRQIFAVGRPRHGSTYRDPATAFYGYMAAVCNGETGSDGETFTEGFKRTELGPVIGTRTWGGWVGIRGDKPLIDRGVITQPEFTGWGLDGKYLIEGWGTDPDIEVKEHPTAELKGKDPQLDFTIEHLLKKIEEEPMVLPEPPEFPDRSGFAK